MSIQGEEWDEKERNEGRRRGTGEGNKDGAHGGRQREGAKERGTGKCNST